MFQSPAVDERARRIVETAVELAEKGGFEAVRLRDVAAYSGVALGTLYRHFRSKEDLLVAALADQVGQLEARMTAHPADGPSANERVCSFFATATLGLCGKPMLAKAMLRAMSSGQPELTEKVASFHGRISQLVAAALRGNGGLTTPGPADNGVGLVLQAVWFTSLVGWGGGLHDRSTVIEQVREAAELILDS